MNTKRSVKLIKKEDRNAQQPEAELGLTADPISMSKAVKSWVSELRKDREGESRSRRKLNSIRLKRR